MPSFHSNAECFQAVEVTQSGCFNPEDQQALEAIRATARKAVYGR